MIYTISTGETRDIQSGDIILVMPGMFEKNTFDVSAVACVDVSDSSLLKIFELDQKGQTKGELIELSPKWILEVWRRVS